MLWNLGDFFSLDVITKKRFFIEIVYCVTPNNAKARVKKARELSDQIWMRGLFNSRVCSQTKFPRVDQSAIELAVKQEWDLYKIWVRVCLTLVRAVKRKSRESIRVHGSWRSNRSESCMKFGRVLFISHAHSQTKLSRVDGSWRSTWNESCTRVEWPDLGESFVQFSWLGVKRQWDFRLT